MSGEVEFVPAVVDLLMSEIGQGSHVLEVEATSAGLTRKLLLEAGHVTVLAPSADAMDDLLGADLLGAERLSISPGPVEGLGYATYYDVALVAYPSMRGMGLLHTIAGLATHVHDRVIVLMEDEGTLDWAYLARTAVSQGFAVRLHLLALPRTDDGIARRAVVLVTDLGDWQPSLISAATWSGDDAQSVHVPYPLERGTATNLVRGFLEGADRAMSLSTDAEGIGRLHGAIRTAVHRLAREEVTVRRTGDIIRVMRVPSTVE